MLTEHVRPRIDVHSHVIPPSLGEREPSNESRPWIELGHDRGEVFVRGRHFRTVDPTCWDMSRRLSALLAAGIDRQVLSPMPELFSYWAPDVDARALCAEVNEWLSDTIEANDAFDAFGIVPLQNPDTAAEMLSEVVALGLAGVEIGSHVNGVPLHDDRFSSFFAEADRLELVVFVHAFHPNGADDFGTAAAANAVLFPLEIGRALGGLVAEGTLCRHASLKVLGSHGGGALSALLPRLDFLWETTDALQSVLPERPSEIARRLHVDSLVYSSDVLDLVIDQLGATAVVGGTDHPFLELPAGVAVELAPTLDANAERLLARAHVDSSPSVSRRGA
jgi:aminocarboxymuconate-semialdehyde decarboxylase